MAVITTMPWDRKPACAHTPPLREGRRLLVAVLVEPLGEELGVLAVDVADAAGELARDHAAFRVQ